MAKTGNSSIKRLAYPFLVLAICIVSPDRPDRASVAAVETKSPLRWKQAMSAFEQKDREESPPKNGIVFVGSSSIRGWDLPKYFPGLPVINRGFGGSQVEDSAYWADQIILPYQPRIVVVYAGDNDVAAGKTAAQVFSDFQHLVKKIHDGLPSTTIVYIAIKPSIKRWELVGEMRKTNGLIRAYCDSESRLAFVDIDKSMIGKDGRPRKELFAEDGLHLNAAGYQLWTDLLRPHLATEPAHNNWPQFRGPLGNGHASAAPVPITWSESENITWKTPVHGQGWSSPIVWDQQIWLTTASEDGKRMYAVCVDRNSGEMIHDNCLFENETVRFKHAMNSFASPTPVAEQGRVYVHFGSYGTACLDMASGQTLWSRRDLPCNHWRGPGSSPIIHQNMLIIHYDGYDYQYVAALDKASGETIWRVDRDIDYGTDDGDLMKAYCTPIVIEVDGRTQLISPAAKATLALDPSDGSELWRLRYDEHSATARPLYGHGLLFIGTGFPKAKFLAVRPEARGDITDSHVVWTATKSIGAKPSPVMVDDLIYVVHDQGTASCLEAASGNVVWTKRIGGQYSASPIYAGGHLYFFNHEGKTTVLKPGRHFQTVAQNMLDDGFMASPAVSGNSLILRTRSHLYRVDS